MEYGLGVDLGTTYTAAAVWVAGRLEIVQLGTRRPEIPSVVFVKTDGEMLIGDAADRRGDAEPDRLVREFKRRMGDPVPILVAGSPYSAHVLTARLLRQVVDTVTRLQQDPPRSITIAHPANWTRFKRDFLDQVVHLADLDGVAFRTEPEMAALQYAATERIRPGETLAVYDLGGGTFDAAVLRKTTTGFELLGTPEGIEHLGGGDFDEAVLDHVTTTLGTEFAGLDLDDDDVVVGLARLRRDCVRAKENLSSDTETFIQVALPGLHKRVRLNRSELEARISQPLDQTVSVMRRALRSARVAPADLRCILLAGGASRIPLVGELLTTAFDRPLVLDAHPEHSVALGAALTTGPAAAEPDAAPVPAPSPAPAPAPAPALWQAPRLEARPSRPKPAARKPAGRTSAAAIRTRLTGALTTRRRRAIAGAAALLVVGSVAATLWWPDAAAETPSPPPVSAAPAGPDQIFAAAVQGPVSTAAGVDAERVYIATGNTIQALRRSDGKPAWPKPFTVPAPIVAAPALAGDTLYVSGRDNHLYAVDTADGDERWSIATGSRYPGPPSVAGGAVYFGTSGGLVSKFRLSDRERQWRFQTGNAVSQPPAVAGDLVVTSSGDGTLYAFDVNSGDKKWTIDLEPSSAPVIAGGRVFVGGGDRLHAIDTRTGDAAWTFETGAPVWSAPVVDAGLVFLGGQDGIVYAIDAATGDRRWQFPGATGEKFSAPAVAAGVVYAATQTGWIYALEAATSRLIWKYRVEGALAPLRLTGGVLYVGTAAKVLYALRVAPAPPSEPAVVSAVPSPSASPTSSPSQRTRRPPVNPPGNRPTTTPSRTRSPTTTQPPEEPTLPPDEDPPTPGNGEPPGDGG